MKTNIPQHITIKQIGALVVIGKANTFTKQLEAIAAHATIGRVPSVQL